MSRQQVITFVRIMNLGCLLILILLSGWKGIISIYSCCMQMLIPCDFHPFAILQIILYPQNLKYVVLFII